MATKNKLPLEVQMHPLVLLSVVDHYHRVNAKTSSASRVVGILLGTTQETKHGDVLDVTQCFAVPFDEGKGNDVWFLDCNYGENMFKMCRKITSKIHVVGWYSSGVDLNPCDSGVHHLIRQHFCPNPIYCTVNVDPNNKGIPSSAYYEVDRPGSGPEFMTVPTSLSAIEGEEIGVDHLLRDLTDSTVSTLSTKVGERQQALGVLGERLDTVATYLQEVEAGTMPVSEEILGLLQEVMNILPLIHKGRSEQSLVEVGNDRELVSYIAEMNRAVLGLYALIANKRRMAKLERDQREKEQEEKEKKEKKEKEEAEASEKSKDDKDGEKKSAKDKK